MAQAAAKSVMFVWEGRDKQGKKVKGEMSGTSDALVKAMLRRQGINPMRVKKKPMPLFGGGGKKITPKDIAIFSRQMATMMSSGVPLVQSFDIVGKGHENPNMQKLILDIKAHVEAGNNLADALARHPLHFDELYVNLVKAGEAAGILETLLDKIATYKEKTEAIKGKIKKALFYPAAVLVMAFVVTAVLMIFVIPQFASLFSDFGADLPAMTLFVISMSNYFVDYWVFIFGGIGLAFWGFFALKKRNKKFRHALERLSLKIPVIGDILIKATIARFGSRRPFPPQSVACDRLRGEDVRPRQNHRRAAIRPRIPSEARSARGSRRSPRAGAAGTEQLQRAAVARVRRIGRDTEAAARRPRRSRDVGEVTRHERSGRQFFRNLSRQTGRVRC